MAPKRQRALVVPSRLQSRGPAKRQRVLQAPPLRAACVAPPTSLATARRWEPAGKATRDLESPANQVSAPTPDRQPTETDSSDTEDDAQAARGRRRERAMSRPGSAEDRLAGGSYLEKRAVTAKTGREYRRQVSMLMEFSRMRRLPLGGHDEVDEAVVEYFNHLYRLGHQASRGSFALAGLEAEFPRFSRVSGSRLARSRRALAGWRKLTPSHSRKALPFSGWCAIGHRLRAAGQYQRMLYCLVGLCGHWRPSEGLRARRCDLIRPAAGVTKCWSLIIAPAEVGRPSNMGAVDDSVLLDGPRIQTMAVRLSELKEGPPTAPLWDFTHADLAAALHTAGRQIGVSPLVPYQLRHSGASIDRASGRRTQDEVMKRGRWRSLRSLARYERHSRLAATLHELPAATPRYAQVCERRLEDIILQPMPPHITFTVLA